MHSVAGMTHTGTLQPTLIRTTPGFCLNVSLHVMFMMRPLSAQHNTYEKGASSMVSTNCCIEMTFALLFGRCFLVIQCAQCCILAV